MVVLGYLPSYRALATSGRKCISQSRGSNVNITPIEYYSILCLQISVAQRDFSFVSSTAIVQNISFVIVLALFKIEV